MAIIIYDLFEYWGVNNANRGANCTTMFSQLSLGPVPAASKELSVPILTYGQLVMEQHKYGCSRHISCASMHIFRQLAHANTSIRHSRCMYSTIACITSCIITRSGSPLKMFTFV